ncbi:hypothetical protein M885DRAFT_572731 [Pelagophyceae sp. CCMP2097]|nr:hypothetical protein M885DRAFT_572731 [Pelagophyceae sp. CCMP2097]
MSWVGGQSDDDDALPMARPSQRQRIMAIEGIRQHAAYVEQVKAAGAVIVRTWRRLFSAGADMPNGFADAKGIAFVFHWMSHKVGVYDCMDVAFHFGAGGPSSLRLLDIAVDLYIAGTNPTDDEDAEPCVVVPGLDPDPASPSAKALLKLFQEKEVSVTVRDASLTRNGIVGPKPSARFGAVRTA